MSRAYVITPDNLQLTKKTGGERQSEYNDVASVSALRTP